MAVRNLRGLTRTKPIPVYVWIPPAEGSIHKIEISDGTTDYDVTDIVIKGEYVFGVTETIGTFNFKIDNSGQFYTDKFSVYDVVNVYLDYGTTASSIRFKGIIERVSKSDSSIIVEGRGPGTKIISKNITYSATNKARSTILKEIISGRGVLGDPDFYEGNFVGVLTTNNVEDDSTTTTVNYFEKPFWDVVAELCNEASFDSYIDVNFDLHYFATNSRQNNKEAVVHEYNIINTFDFAPDASSIFNKVRVYGSDVDGIPYLATSQDSTSQDNFEVRDLKIDDANIKSQEQAQARADFELSLNKDPPTIGTIISLGLPTLLPGEQLRISDSLNDISPGFYKVFEFRHKFSNDEPFMTEVTIQKQRTNLPDVLKKRLKFESDASANNNPSNMDFSKIYDFNEDSGVHDSTKITDGVLKLSTGSSGSWTSDNFLLTSNLSTFTSTLKGSVLSGTKVFLSIDGGTVFKQIAGLGTPSSITITAETANNIKIRIDIFSATTEIDTFGLLYTLV